MEFKQISVQTTLIYIKLQEMKFLKISLISIVVGAFLYYYYNFSPVTESSKFLSCPSKMIFGLNCPGCGSQRMIHSLLHFRFSEAFGYNPLLFLVLPFVLILTFQFVSNTFFNTNYRIKLLYNNKFVWSLFAVLLVYMVLRNMDFWPFVK